MLLRLLSVICAMAVAVTVSQAQEQVVRGVSPEPPAPRGYIGVRVAPVTNEEAEALGWKAARGVKILSRHEDGPAARAGLMVNDIIVAVDGEEIEARQTFSKVLGAKRPGGQVRLKLWRSGSEQEVTVGLAPAQDIPPSQDPILRIDPGMHTQTILRVGADSACTLLATASTDKSVRLWNVRDGSLLRSLRAPIDPGGGGEMRAVAVAPDGSWVAAGGVDAAAPTMQSHFVYVFQASTGSVIARLGPLPQLITHLAVSSDGRHLAAGLGGGKGLRIWEKAAGSAPNWRLIAEDADYGPGATAGAAFDREGVLFTTSDDGKLRRYMPPYNAKPTWVVTQAGAPTQVAVQPSGARVAVSLRGSTPVQIYSADTLALLFSPDTKGTSGTLWAIAWSADGERLYAGGTFARKARMWDRGGEGQPRDFEGAENTIQHMITCRDGIAMGSSDPAFGIFGADGSRLLWREDVQADLRGQTGEKGFSVAPDGRRVRFGLKPGGATPVLFDLMAERLSDSPDTPAELTGADTKSLFVTDWKNNLNPKLGGAAIKLPLSEMVRSLAITPDKQGFVLGSEWSLTGLDKSGKLLWRRWVASTAWGVNISQDGKLLVVAYGDGTIRWHRLSDGQELLALFVHAKDRRWVAWTPRGYYMASAGAESLIGWHVNRGWNEAAQFFSVDRFRAQFNRPDIVKLVLETLDEAKAIDAANKHSGARRAVVADVIEIAPPVVVIQKPGDASTFRSTDVTLEYDVFSPTGKKITKVDYLINNSVLGARSAAPIDMGKFSFSGKVTLPLPPEDVTITLVAYEGTRASEPTSVRLRWDGAKPGQVVLPRLRALFVGVNAYGSPKLSKLAFAAKDAADLASFFKGQEGKSYSRVEAKILSDAKRADTLEGLDWLEKGSEEGDINLLFLAGHGFTLDQTFYYMAADSDPDKARSTAVSRDEILTTIRNRKGAMVVMLDACHSGATTDAPPSGPGRVDMNRLANELGDKTLGVLLYASARGRQFSYERAEWGNGAFTRAVLDGLAGAADSGQLGYVETDELAVYVRRRVMAMTKGLQEPVRVKPDAAPEMKIARQK